MVRSTGGGAWLASRSPAWRRWACRSAHLGLTRKGRSTCSAASGSRAWETRRAGCARRCHRPGAGQRRHAAAAGCVPACWPKRSPGGEDPGDRDWRQCGDDGQVLVMHDMLGLSLTGRARLKFVKGFHARPSIPAAIAALYPRAVKGRVLPAAEHGFNCGTPSRPSVNCAPRWRPITKASRIGFGDHHGQPPRRPCRAGKESRRTRRLRGRQHLRPTRCNSAPAKTSTNTRGPSQPTRNACSKPAATCCSPRPSRKCNPTAWTADPHPCSRRLRRPLRRQSSRPFLKAWRPWSASC